MHPLIVVDDKIAGVKRALEDSGYQVRDLSQGWEQAAAIVVSGMDDNFLGRQDIVSRAPVIDAAGRDIDEVIADVNRVLRLKS
jgi:hypothetical protein